MENTPTTDYKVYEDDGILILFVEGIQTSYAEKIPDFQEIYNQIEQADKNDGWYFHARFDKHGGTYLIFFCT